MNASIESINQTLEEYWEEIAETHGGTLTKLSKNREDLPATFFVILTNLIGTGSVKELECGPGYIEPYTERTIFTFFKSQTTLGVSCEGAMGRWGERAKRQRQRAYFVSPTRPLAPSPSGQGLVLGR